MIKKLIVGILVLMVLLPGCIGRQTQTSPPDSSTKPSASVPSKPTPGPDTKPTPTTEAAQIKIVGQIGGPIQAIAVQEKYAYVGIGMRLAILDVSNPAALNEVGATEPFGWYVEDVVVIGNMAFVAAGGAGLYIIDISNSTRPIIVGSHDTPGYAEAVVVSGKCAYIADGPAGLLVIDITDYSRPVEVAAAYRLNYAFDVFIQDTYAYISAAGAGLLVADISNPAKPKEIGSLDTPGYAYGVTVSGNTAYVADGWGGLRIVDISTATNPVEVSSVETSGWVVDIIVEQDVAYLADISSGVYLSDVSDRTRPTKPAALWGDKQESSGWRVTNLGFNQNLLWAIDRNTGLWLINLSNPEKPTTVGLYSPMNFAGSIDVSGMYGYVAGAFAYSSALRVLDLSDPTRPREVIASGSKEQYKCIKLADNLAYVFGWSDGECLSVLDISNPSQPKVISSQALNGPSANMLLTEKTAYVTTEFGFELIDISNPAKLLRLGAVDFTGGLGRAAGANSAWGVAVSGSMAYVTYADTLYIIDVSNPTSPAIVTSFKPPDMPKAGPIVVDSQFAFIAVVGGIAVVDMSSPKEPRVVSRCSLPGGPSQLVLKDKILYSASQAEGLLAIDVSNPQNPVLIGSRQLPGRAFDIAVDAKYIYVANGEGGFYVLERISNKSTTGKVSMSSFGTETKVLGSLTSSTSELVTFFLSPTVQPSIPSQEINVAEYRPAVINLVQGKETPLVPSVLPGSGKILTVTSEADSGTGTLRWALESARGGDVITFDSGIFSPKNPLTIRPKSPLPYLDQGSLTIDASNAGVILDGSATPKGAHGLLITSDHNTIKGLQVIGFPGAGIGIAGGSYNTIGGDRTLGTGPTGEGNVVSGNKMVGIGMSNSVDGVVTDAGTASNKEAAKEGTVTIGNRIIGNYIGTDSTGSKALGNQGTGVWVFGNGDVSQNVIGGLTPNERNVISGNVRAGVTLLSGNRNIVMGNYIGTDASGTKAIGNEWMGLTIEGGFNNIIKGNVISGNGNGLIISDPGASCNEVIGNLIGTDATGTIAVPNRGVGVSINESFNKVGGTSPEERNIISGNAGAGLQIGWRSTTSVVIIGNFIGTDVTGTKALGNSSNGISFNEDAYHNFIGGFTLGERNVISGNDSNGIGFGSAGERFNSIVGNCIGTDASGKLAIPNRDTGIGIYSGDNNYIMNNIIAYNTGGILIKLGAGNNIYHNSFKENGKTSDFGNGNMWDDGHEGNYWSDYRGKDSDGDGIGDTPYPVPPNGADRYPFMNPHEGVLK